MGPPVDLWLIRHTLQCPMRDLWAVALRRLPGAGLWYVWGLGREESANYDQFAAAH